MAAIKGTTGQSDSISSETCIYMTSLIPCFLPVHTTLLELSRNFSGRVLGDTNCTRQAETYHAGRDVADRCECTRQVRMYQTGANVPRRSKRTT